LEGAKADIIGESVIRDVVIGEPPRGLRNRERSKY